MKLKMPITLTGVLMPLLFIFPSFTEAQTLNVKEDFFKGVIQEITENKTINELGQAQLVREMTVDIKNSGKNESVKIEDTVDLMDNHDPVMIKKGDGVVVSRLNIEGEVKYTLMEPYRLNALIWIFAFFMVLVLIITGKKGLFALGGLALSLVILIKCLIPAVVAGGNPLLLSFLASGVICVITFYLGHGFKKRTTLALLSTLGTLVLAFLFSVVAVKWAQLSGTGTEEAFSLNLAGMTAIDLRGLFLGAIVIGTLGVLDDVTVTQIATVYQIHKANAKLGFRELYKRGLSVGKDHIASIINTLVLAYAGVSFPTLILLVTSTWPVWMTLNNEYMAEEIVRTLVGSITLVLAVPISTLMAAYFYSRQKK